MCPALQRSRCPTSVGHLRRKHLGRRLVPDWSPTPGGSPTPPSAAIVRGPGELWQAAWRPGHQTPKEPPARTSLGLWGGRWPTRRAIWARPISFDRFSIAGSACSTARGACSSTGGGCRRRTTAASGCASTAGTSRATPTCSTSRARRSLPRSTTPTSPPVRTSRRPTRSQPRRSDRATTTSGTSPRRWAARVRASPVPPPTRGRSGRPTGHASSPEQSGRSTSRFRSRRRWTTPLTARWRSRRCARATRSR